jgi:hypothetical protein
MRILIFILGAFILFTGCKKTEEEIIVPAVIFIPPGYSTPPESIHYTTLNPEVVVSYDTINNVDYYRIDLNNDSAFDFSFYASRQKVDVYGHIYYAYMFGCSGWGKNMVTLLHAHPSAPDIIYLHDSTLVVDSTLPIWRQDSYLYFDVPFSYGYECESDTSKFLGLMVHKNNRQYYGWVRLDWDKTTMKLTVKNFAIRNEPDLSIRAGEK